MNSRPLFRAGQYVEVNGGGVYTGPLLNGKRYVLFGSPKYLSGMWAWPVPGEWLRQLERGGFPVRHNFHLGEARLRRVADRGRELTTWDAPGTVWRPHLDLLQMQAMANPTWWSMWLDRIEREERP